MAEKAADGQTLQDFAQEKTDIFAQGVQAHNYRIYGTTSKLLIISDYLIIFNLLGKK